MINGHNESVTRQDKNFMPFLQMILTETLSWCNVIVWNNLGIPEMYEYWIREEAPVDQKS